MRTVGMIVGAIIGGLIGGPVGAAIGAGIGGAAATAATGGTTGQIITAGLAPMGGSIADVMGAVQESKEKKQEAARELDILKGNLLKPLSKEIEGTSLSEIERRRRAQIVDSKNNMNNLLSGPSSDSSTGPLLKTQLGTGSLIG